MGSIAMGTAGILFMLASDWADWKKLPALKTAAFIAAAALFIAASVSMLVSPGRFPIAAGVRIAGGAFAAVFFLLLVYSLFIELPFLRTYGTADGDRVVVSEGTYALSRHPGVLWFFFLHLSLVAASGSPLLLLAVPFWTGANVFVVYVEDAVIFPRIFGDAYNTYRRSVPFLVPTVASVRKCLVSISKNKRD